MSRQIEGPILEKKLFQKLLSQITNNFQQIFSMIKRIFDKENPIWKTRFGDFSPSLKSPQFESKNCFVGSIFGQKSAFDWQYNIVLQKWGHTKQYAEPIKADKIRGKNLTKTRNDIYYLEYIFYVSYSQYIVHRTHVSRRFKSWNCHYKVLSRQLSNVPLKKSRYNLRRYMLRFFYLRIYILIQTGIDFTIRKY